MSHEGKGRYKYQAIIPDEALPAYLRTRSKVRARRFSAMCDLKYMLADYLDRRRRAGELSVEEALAWAKWLMDLATLQYTSPTTGPDGREWGIKRRWEPSFWG